MGISTKYDMHQKTRSKTSREPSKRSFERALETSGLSKKVTNRVWDWYHPQENK